MFDLHFRCTSTIIASCILIPALAYIPCSRVSHVKYRLLPKDSMTLADISAAIGISSIVSRDINECLPEDLKSAGYQLGGGREKFRGGRKARTTKTSEVVEITPTCIC
jgi:hypothetical protein